MDFKTSPNASASTARLYEDIWSDWVAFCGEVNEDPAKYTDKSYNEWLQALEDQDLWSNASSAIRHVYKAHGMSLPPTRLALLAAGLLKKSAGQAAPMASTPPAERKLSPETAAIVHSRLRPPELVGTYVSSLSSLDRGDFVRIGRHYYQYTGVALAACDSMGRRTGNIHTLGWFRKAQGGYRIPTYDSDVVSSLCYALKMDVGVDVQSAEDLALELVCVTLGVETVDDLLETYGTPDKVAEAVLDIMYPVEAEEEDLGERESTA